MIGSRREMSPQELVVVPSDEKKPLRTFLSGESNNYDTFTKCTTTESNCSFFTVLIKIANAQPYIPFRRIYIQVRLTSTFTRVRECKYWRLIELMAEIVGVLLAFDNQIYLSRQLL